MITQYGFTFGPCEVTRIASSDKHGAWIEVRGERERIEIRVTKSGLLRVGPTIKRLKAKKQQDSREVSAARTLLDEALRFDVPEMISEEEPRGAVLASWEAI